MITKKILKLASTRLFEVANVDNREIKIHVYAIGKREIVTREQISPLIVVYCLYNHFYLKKISSFTPVLSIRIVLDSLYLLTFYSEKFPTWIWCLPFAVNLTLNLSNKDCLRKHLIWLPGYLHLVKPAESLPRDWLNAN